jgi:hypothetical protein
MAVVAGSWAANYNAYLPFTTGYLLCLLMAASFLTHTHTHTCTHIFPDALP